MTNMAKRDAAITAQAANHALFRRTKSAFSARGQVVGRVLPYGVFEYVGRHND